ncbi:MAG TPA: endonuclease domain-containing protein [Dongiaceae bacterium]|nr:endonuclease domain-containing protein [Dongiaceae bacterium]
MPNEFARQLRKNMTDAERALWRLLRQRQIHGVRFRRQVPIDQYIADFACLEMKLVIEADGGQHSESQTDKVRDAYLRSQGFFVLRLWNNDILTNSDGVYRVITETVERLSDAARARLAARHPPSSSG